MKNCFFLIIYFFFLVSFSQNHVAKGIVLDENTKAPISYVNISILKSQIGTSSHEDGSYVIEVLKADLNKNIKLSSLGYKDSIIGILKFVKLKTIFLKPLNEQLDEVVIKRKYEERFLTVNPIKRKHLKSGVSTSENPWKIAVFFPYIESYEKTKYLNEIKIYLNKNTIISKSRPSRFVMRIFSVGNNKLPNKDLVSENIIIQTTKKQKEVNVDISQFNLVFPKEGLYVALEWLHIPFNEYEIEYTKKGSKAKYRMKKYSPSFSFITEGSGINRIAIFSSGLWNRGVFFKDHKDRLMIPAISLTLSN